MTEKLSFESKPFFRIIISYVMTTIWSIVCFLLDEHYGVNKFYLKAFGFVTLFCMSFIIGLRILNAGKIILLFLVFISTFYFVSFFVMSILAVLSNNSLLLGGLIMSLISVTILTVTLNSVRRIEFIYPCIIVTTLCALPAYLALNDPADTLHLDYNIHPTIVLFNTWQGLTVISLALGLCVKRRPQIPSIQNNNQEAQHL